MRLFVTGGAGFVGSAFVRWVLSTQPDVEVTTYDALTYAGNRANLRDVADDPRHRFVHGDIADPAAVGRALAGHDAVVNFAAESHVDRSISSARPFLTTNVVGAGVLFDAARAAGVARVLHVSTDEVYGSVPPGRTVAEDAPLRPNSPYAASKASADLLARAVAVTHGYPITVTRASNTFGPFHHPEKVIPRFVTNLIAGRPVPLYGDGANVREWLYVGDNVRAQWAALTAGEPGAIYNIGAGTSLTNLELTRRILDRFGCGDEMIRRVPDRPGHDLRYAVDASRIRALGWAPQWSFDAALDETVAWYRTHEGWWRPLLASAPR